MEEERIGELPWIHNPKRLWSLREVFEGSAQQYIRTLNTLHNVTVLICHTLYTLSLNASHPMPIDKVKDVSSAVAAFADDCDGLGATASARHARRVVEALGSSDTSWRDVDSLIKLVAATFFDEMEGFQFLLLDKNNADMHKGGGEPYFGPEAYSAFSSSAFDMDEAMSCLALRRWTASVFHLGRIGEGCMKAVYISLGLPLSTKPNEIGWGYWSGRVGEFIEGKPPHVHPPDWATKKTFYEEMHADLRAVNRAWRNPTMHMDKVYSEDDALKIKNAVIALVKDAVTHLDENGTYTP